MNRVELQRLAEIRIAEAAALLAASPPLPDGAYYLAGYAVECALKACVAKLIREHDRPDKKFVVDAHTHDLAALVRLADLAKALERARTVDAAFAQNWEIVRSWNERSRYERHSTADAERLIVAVSHPFEGVLPWIKSRW